LENLKRVIFYFSLKSHEEIESNEKEYADNPRQLKAILAEELTRRVHSDEAYESVLNVSEILFNKKASKETLTALSVDDLELVAGEIQSFEASKADFGEGINIVDLIAGQTSIVNSNGDARRAIKGNAISVNKDKIASHEAIISASELMHGQYLMVENGKKNKFIVKFS